MNIEKISYQTPIEKLGLIASNELFMKYDNLIPFSFGGNKARKSRFFFRELLNEKYDCVVTYGSSSSNHCRIIANMAASKDIPCYVVMPESNYRKTFNCTLVEMLFGARIILCSIDEVSQTIDSVLNNLYVEGRKPYFIQGGGHGNLGTQAYVEAFEEIMDYELQNHMQFDYIFHASGTGTTQAGLVCGKLLHQHPVEIVGISIARGCPYGRNVVVQSVSEYLVSVGKQLEDESAICFTDDYISGGYGQYNSKIKEVVKRVMREYGIALNTTYTGKSFWGMEQYIATHGIERKNILFLNTGGTPLYFDELENISK